MAYDRNSRTLEALTQEIKTVKGQCKEACYIIGNNAPIEAQDITPENCNEKSLQYVEAVCSSIETSSTDIINDSNYHTSQFLHELKENSKQVDELVAFTKGNIHDVESEVNRLQTQIKISQEARSRGKTKKREVQAEHLHKARDRFKMMKDELHSLIQTLYPKNADSMLEILGELISGHLSENADGYIEVTTRNINAIELFKDMNIVTVNPYNNMEVKIAF